MTLKHSISPGSSSLASHFALEEHGTRRQAPAPEQDALDPRGVPALGLESGNFLSETVAILYYLGT